MPMGVRWQAGQHARTINELLLKLSDTPPEQLLEEFLGHTPLQVACGALLGRCGGYSVFPPVKI